jgi:hypothetical protein
MAGFRWYLDAWSFWEIPPLVSIVLDSSRLTADRYDRFSVQFLPSLSENNVTDWGAELEIWRINGIPDLKLPRALFQSQSCSVIWIVNLLRWLNTVFKKMENLQIFRSVFLVYYTITCWKTKSTLLM